MTTIAFDGKALAADSQTSMYKQSAVKIHRTKRGLFGSCGELQDNVAVLDWLNDPTAPKPTVSDRFHAILIDGGKCYSMETKLIQLKQGSPFFAVGSGREYAMAAMHLGCDAKRAVQVASVFDTDTGGEIVELTEESNVFQFDVAWQSRDQ